MSASLASLFLRHVPDGGAIERDDLERHLAAFWARCQGAWPGVALPASVFLRHLACHLREAELPASLDSIHGEDLYLACACAQGLPAAVAAFADRHLSQVPSYLGGLDLSAAQADEARQRVQVHLLCGDEAAPPRIGEYGGRGPLGGWVRISALRTALMLLRDRHEQHVRGTEALLDRLASPAQDAEGAYLKGRYREALREAFRDAVRGLPLGQRRVLRLHFLEGQTFAELAAQLQVSRATAVREVARAREAVLKETRRLLRERLRLRPGEDESLVGLLRSQLGPSVVGSLLEDPEGGAMKKV